MGFSFIHTSDWQLGKQFSNISGDSGAALREQRIETIKTIAKSAQERKVDAIVVSNVVSITWGKDGSLHGLLCEQSRQLRIEKFRSPNQFSLSQRVDDSNKWKSMEVCIASTNPADSVFAH